MARSRLNEADAIFVGTLPGDFAGEDLGAVGDLDGDGLDELLLARPGRSRALLVEDRQRHPDVEVVRAAVPAALCCPSRDVDKQRRNETPDDAQILEQVSQDGRDRERRRHDQLRVLARIAALGLRLLSHGVAAQVLLTEVFCSLASALRQREQVELRLDWRHGSCAVDHLGTDEDARIVGADELHVRAARLDAGFEKVSNAAGVLIDEDADEPEVRESVEHPCSRQPGQCVRDARFGEAVDDLAGELDASAGRRWVAGNAGRSPSAA